MVGQAADVLVHRCERVEALLARGVPDCKGRMTVSAKDDLNSLARLGTEDGLAREDALSNWERKDQGEAPVSCAVYRHRSRDRQSLSGLRRRRTLMTLSSRRHF